MSSSEGDFSNEDTTTRQLPNKNKSRVSPTCDRCRANKIRCTGLLADTGKCVTCAGLNSECTYDHKRKRGAPKAYVDALKARHQKLEELIEKLFPDANFIEELGPPIDLHNWSQYRTTDESNQFNAKDSDWTLAISSGSSSTAPDPINSDNSAPEAKNRGPSDDEHEWTGALGNSLRGLSIDPLQERFIGEASPIGLLRSARNLGSQYSGKSKASDSSLWKGRSISQPPKWEGIGEELLFPEPDLMQDVVRLYFENINILIPILHRPTFEKGLADDLHLRDKGFGGVVLLVCATGGRHSNDPRVLLEGTETSYHRHSSGWKWFSQVSRMRRIAFSPPRLYDLQMSALSVIFLHGCSPPQACWIMAGIGLRQGQDVGAHRRKSYHLRPNVIDEMWKRAFWCIVLLDRMTSALLGRPRAIQDVDMDVDFPMDCDDEFWTRPDPEKAFKQPTGKPSTMSFFINMLKLTEIQNIALNTMYPISKSRYLRGRSGPEWEQDVVLALDSELNKFIDSVPDHLRWDPTCQNIIHLKQSANLYGAYYTLQILVHRPFILSSRKISSQSFPSLAICTNAARACSHVVDVLRRRLPGMVSPNFLGPAFISGIMLLVNIWGRKKSGLSIDPVKEMEDVHLCIQVLRDSESRWPMAGRLLDILSELAFAGVFPPLKSGLTSNKRGREVDSPPPRPRTRVSSSSHDTFTNAFATPLEAKYGTTDFDYLFTTLPEHSDALQRISTDWPLEGYQSSDISPLNQFVDFFDVQAAMQTSSFGNMPFDQSDGLGSSFFDITQNLGQHSHSITGSSQRSAHELVNESDLVPLEVPDLTNTAIRPSLNLDTQPRLDVDSALPAHNPEDLEAILRNMLDEDVLRAMWAEMPINLELDNWQAYSSNITLPPERSLNDWNMGPQA
ncbi:hypothetical protein EW146_g7482 [Bondarzewia mesenterica]|uniref:Zn(2)-C6 fungal-type domain-containing protein n=1 Tax=Bondarzewia mesenterica TaxID=1095465 RepID=A0A4S4LKM7_9AGAM|nr:hypothetical protein EW146_g7482 [Bondarzewia mesenterica]